MDKTAVQNDVVVKALLLPQESRDQLIDSWEKTAAYFERKSRTYTGMTAEERTSCKAMYDTLMATVNELKAQSHGKQEEERGSVVDRF